MRKARSLLSASARALKAASLYWPSKASTALYVRPRRMIWRVAGQVSGSRAPSMDDTTPARRRALGHPWPAVEQLGGAEKGRVVDLDRCAAHRPEAPDRLRVESRIGLV